MIQPRLSIGIPVYNQFKTIAQTIESVLAQKVAFDEILVVDNHSTDGTLELLEKFLGRIRVIQPPEHLSMVANWNYCIENMNCQWFSLISGDDLLKAEFVSQVKKAITAHQDAALIRTDWDVIDDSGKVTTEHNQLSVAHITRPPRTWQEQLNGPKTAFVGWATQRKFWKEAGGFPTDFHLFQDWMFWLKLAPHGPFIRIPIRLAQYRSYSRPELEFHRVALRLADEHRYLVSVLPSLPWGAGTRHLAKISSVRKQRLIDLLNYISRHPKAVENSDSKSKLAELAELAGITSTYERWLTDHKSIRPIHTKPLHNAKLFIKWVLAKLKAANK